MDTLWVDHLENMEHLRDSVRLRAYGQQDPLVEYKNEGHRMFQDLLRMIESSIVKTMLGASLKKEPVPIARPVMPNTKPSGQPQKIGRNDPCPCGSGKKFKKCHGK